MRPILNSYTSFDHNIIRKKKLRKKRLYVDNNAVVCHGSWDRVFQGRSASKNCFFTFPSPPSNLNREHPACSGRCRSDGAILKSALTVNNAPRQFYGAAQPPPLQLWFDIYGEVRPSFESHETMLVEALEKHNW